ncbi:hypothetical protein H6P81_021556 [Aristolochia fimbriata]|uniref:Uncharacterized protein n=1 Tax=Aristolochia fimbriata TaxID=158543 RepID=A0AAV7DPL0_ARIFI|nr:hypothetical protein H6P81_021556 [Aristolochia fimbriata]
MAKRSTSSLKIKGTFFPHHYITYGSRHLFGPLSVENGSIMKSMAMVNFFIEKKGTFFPYIDITNGSGPLFGRTRFGHYYIKNELDNEIHDYDVDFFIENKGTFFPYLYITYEKQRTLWSYMRKWVIMKSMAMVDFFIENKGMRKYGSIMKSLAMVDFFIENKGTFFPYHYITYGNRHALVNYLKNGSIMKSMAMVDFFIENKRNFLPISLHYLWKQTSFGHYICENGSIMKSMAIIDFLVENKGTFFPHRHYLWKQTLFGPYLENDSIMKSMAMVNFFLKIKVSAKNGAIMKSMTMVSLFIENKELSSISLHYLWKQTSALELSSHIMTLPMEADTLWSIISKMDAIMKSMAMVNFFIEKKGTFFPYHYITNGNGLQLWSLSQNELVNEIHDYGATSSLKIKELSSHIITLPMETGLALWSLSAKIGR